jgi:hypothetical protein
MAIVTRCIPGLAGRRSLWGAAARQAGVGNAAPTPEDLAGCLPSHWDLVYSDDEALMHSARLKARSRSGTHGVGSVLMISATSSNSMTDGS